jgi:hypothetical protein
LAFFLSFLEKVAVMKIEKNRELKRVSLLLIDFATKIKLIVK